MTLDYYYKGVKAPSKKQRYEVVAACGKYPVFEDCLINKRGSNRGGHSFNFRKGVPSTVGSNRDRQADYYLSKSEHISSIFNPNYRLPYCWGDVMHPKTKFITKDALLIIVSPDFLEVEIFVAIGKRNLVRLIYQDACDGNLDGEVEYFRSQATNYDSVA